MNDHRLGSLKYCAVSLGFSRLIVGRISSSLHLCGHLLCVRWWRCLWQRHLSAYFDLSFRGCFDNDLSSRGCFGNLFCGYGDVLHVCTGYMFVTVFVAYTSFLYHAQLWRRQYWRMLGHTETEEFRTQAVPTSIYRDEHGGYRLFIPARAVVVSETYLLFTIHVSCLPQLLPRHCSRIVRD